MKLAAFVRVCFGMCPHAVFASAARTLSRGDRMEQVDQVLMCPNRDCAFAFDDDPAAPSAFLGDFSAIADEAPFAFDEAPSAFLGDLIRA